ncbi:MAG: NUDIX hydrolase [Candidatus Hodarchaeota archaeon]
MPSTTNDYLLDPEYIRNKLLLLDSPKRLKYDDPSFVKSAILFLLKAHQNKPYDLILIRRTTRKKDKHSGEISFPGGKKDPTDTSLEETALRECEEELNIPRSNINILGSFNDHLTPKFFMITPVVGFIKNDQEMQKNDAEVEEILEIPISFFINKNNYKDTTFNLKGDTLAVGSYRYRSPDGILITIFGATAHMIVSYIELVHGITLIKEGCRRATPADFEKLPRQMG